MHVSLQSKVCLGTCIAVSAYAAYSNPARWVTYYAIGVIVGGISGYSDLQGAIKGHQPENGLKWDADKDKKLEKMQSNLLLSIYLEYWRQPSTC